MNAFDDSVDAMEIVQDHARAVLELEEESAQKIVAVYGEVAAKLRARLRSLPKDSFSAQQVRVTLMQLQGALNAVHSGLSKSVVDSSAVLTRRGVSDLVTEADSFNDYFEGAMQPVNLDIVQAAIDTDSRLINTFPESITAYSNSLRQRISDGLAKMAVERVGPEVMYQRMIEDDGIGKFFDGEAWKVRRIVRTELSSIYATAKLQALGRVVQDNPEMRKALFHPNDKRTGKDSLWLIQKQAGDRLNTSAYRLRPKWDENFFYTWKTKGKSYQRMFMAPPDRPNDRSILIPYHPSWG